MYTSINGIYENGTLTLLEPAPKLGKLEVLVTFLSEEEQKESPKPRIPDGLRRLDHLKNAEMSLPKNFNKPLEDLNEYK